MANVTLENLKKLADAVGIGLEEVIMLLSVRKSVQYKEGAETIKLEDFDNLTESLDPDKFSDFIWVARKIASCNMSTGALSQEEIDMETMRQVDIFKEGLDDLSDEPDDLEAVFLLKNELAIIDARPNEFNFDENGQALVEKIRAIPTPQAITDLVDAVNAVLNSDEKFETE